MWSNLADIGQQPKISGSIREYELDWLPSVMRHRIWLNFQCINIKSPMAVDDTHIHATGNGLACDERPMTHPDRKSVTSGKRKCTTNVVTMFVGKQDSRKVLRSPPQASETP